MSMDMTRYAVENLLNRKMRSWLTVLSILIGIMAIFTIVSFGEGLKKYIDDVGEDMGTDKLSVQAKGFAPPGTSSIRITESNLKKADSVVGVEKVSPMVMKMVEVKDKKDGKGKYVYVIGMIFETEDIKLIEDMSSIDIDKGRRLNQGERYKALLGYNYQLPDKVFKNPVRLRDNIYIGEYKFKVAGFYTAVGNPQDDSNIYISLDMAKEILETGDNYDWAVVQVGKEKDPAVIAEKVQEAIRKDRGQKKGAEDIYVQTFDEMLAMFSNVVNILNAVLFLIAFISVVVSAINIANTMYTSVLERTKEIGIMKAIGAQNKDIMFIFLIESGLLGMMGGIIGIGIGYLISTIGGTYLAAAGYGFLKPYFPWWLIISCLLFSFFVGMIAGTAPAYQASKMRPVDALRYE